MAGIVLFCIFMTGIFLANILLYMMIGEVNRERRDSNLVSYFWFTLPKMFRIVGEYRRLYPESNIHIYMLISSAVAFASLTGAAVCARIIGG